MLHSKFIFAFSVLTFFSCCHFTVKASEENSFHSSDAALKEIKSPSNQESINVPYSLTESYYLGQDVTNSNEARVKQYTKASDQKQDSGAENPAPFGFELGKATLKDLQKKHRIISEEKNTYNGVNHIVDVNTLGLEGLKAAVFSFNDEGFLQFVLLMMDKQKFNFMMESLAEKYNLLNKKIPFVGDREAKFECRDSFIFLEAPHLSNNMSVWYTTKFFYALSSLQSAKKENQKKQEQKNLL